MPQFNRMKIARELFPACKLFPHTRNARAHSLNCYRAVASRKIIVVYKFWVQSEHDLQSELDLTKSSRDFTSKIAFMIVALMKSSFYSEM